MIVSHDPKDTLSWADEIIVMKAGRIVQQGSPETIYRKPVNEYVAGLFGKYNLIKHSESRPFAKFIKRKEPKKNILIRPEHFKIVMQGLKGKVIDIGFYGSHYEIVVLLSKKPITITIEIRSIKVEVGDTIFIAPSERDVCYI
jgi:ABC-type sugar transport system ATPase subunit